MSTQLDIFTRPQVIDRPRAARKDPVTSHIAADHISKSGALGNQQQIAMALVRANPGRTSAELAELFANHRVMDRYAFARRLPELAKGDEKIDPVIRQGEARVCSVSKRPAVTWWPI